MTDELPDTIEATLTRAMRLETGGTALEQGETGEVPLDEYLAHPDWFDPARPREAKILEALAGTYQTRQSILAELDAMPEDHSDPSLVAKLEEMLADVRDQNH